MKALREGAFEHLFDDSWTVSKYDEWPFYVQHFQNQCATNKGVDFVARDPKNVLWFVELKDFRRVHRSTKSIELASEVALKVRDSLAGIVAAAKSHSNHFHQNEARDHLAATKLRIVLHLEQPAHRSKLFATNYDRANLQQKLRQLVRAVDPHPIVMELASTQGVPWTAVSTP